jgi:hypothetical protein
MTKPGMNKPGMNKPGMNDYPGPLTRRGRARRRPAAR